MNNPPFISHDYGLDDDTPTEPVDIFILVAEMRAHYRQERLSERQNKQRATLARGERMRRRHD